MTPDQLKVLFDGWWVMGTFLLGVAIKYFPPLANVSNKLIGWINVIVYILGHVATSMVAKASAQDTTAVMDTLTAASGTASIASPAWVLVTLGALTTAGWARTMYETLGRPTFEGIGIPKAVVKPSMDDVEKSPSKKGRKI